MNKVVIVDDEQFVREGLRSLIDWEGCGYEILAEADNGEDALNIINVAKPDLVITDIRMPVLDGLELIENVLKTSDASSKFIIISGYSDFKYAQKALRFGVSDFVLKPIDKEELESTLITLAETIKIEKLENEKRSKLMASTLFENLVLGNVTSEVDEYYKKILRVEKCEQYFYLSIEINGLYYQQLLDRNEITKDRIIDVMKYVAKTAEPIHLHEQRAGVYGLVVTSKDLRNYQNKIEYFAEKLQVELQRKLENQVTIYVGKAINQLPLLKDSYDTANDAINLKYSHAHNYPVIYDNLKNTIINYSELSDSLYNHLMLQVEENNVEKIRSTIDEIFQEFGLKFFAYEAVKTSINRCVHGVIGRIKNFDGDLTKISSLESMLEWDHFNFTTTQLKARFLEFMKESAEQLLELRKENAKGDINKIKNYIELHFRDNISLKTIANTFFMNPVYMGQLFKKTYGVYFKDFLLNLRLTEAKKLLRQTNKRVYEIAEEVGFGSADYFVTQFEKSEGITPSEYRNQLLKS